MKSLRDNVCVGKEGVREGNRSGKLMEWVVHELQQGEYEKIVL